MKSDNKFLVILKGIEFIMPNNLYKFNNPSYISYCKLSEKMKK